MGSLKKSKSMQAKNSEKLFHIQRWTANLGEPKRFSNSTAGGACLQAYIFGSIVDESY